MPLQRLRQAWQAAKGQTSSVPIPRSKRVPGGRPDKSKRFPLIPEYWIGVGDEENVTNPSISNESKNSNTKLQEGANGKRELERDDRITDALWKPEDEFPGGQYMNNYQDRLHREIQVAGRIAKASFLSVFQPTRLLLLTSCCSCVLGLTAYEGYVLLAPDVGYGDSIIFMSKYSVENFFPSVLYQTKSGELLATYMGYDPSTLLRQLDLANPEDISIKMRILSAYTARSIIAGFMYTAQLLSILHESMMAAYDYVESVYEGKAPPLIGVQERVLRLAGNGSDVTEVSMKRYAPHILPVFETPSKFRHLVDQWSFQGRVPCIWQVPAGYYGFRHAWKDLHVDASYMLKTTTAKEILCIEADATNIDRAFHLQQPNNSITIEDASQAFRLLERTAGNQLQRPFRRLCVFLGDSTQLCDTGGTSQVTLRERIALKKEADVLIDAKAPLLIAVLRWCTRYVDERKTIVVDAPPPLFQAFQVLLETRGYTVLEPAEADVEQTASETVSVAKSNVAEKKEDKELSEEDKVKAEKVKEKQKEKWPRLVYYHTTAATINAVRSTLATGVKLADPSKICVLVNRPFGLEHLREIAESYGEPFRPICSAYVYDDYFRQVRVWTRMGYSATAIQKELDTRFEEVADIQAAITQAN